MNDLFNSDSVGTFHNELAGRLKQAVGQLTAEQVADQPAAVEQVVPALLSRVPAFEREKTRFEPTDQPGGRVQVKITIPVVGNVEYLRLRPNKVNQGAVRPEGYVTGLEIGPREPAVVLTHSFDAGVSADQIKEWTRQHLQRVEAWLEQIGRELQAVAAQLHASAVEQVQQRAAALSAATRLKDELGTGI